MKLTKKRNNVNYLPVCIIFQKYRNIYEQDFTIRFTFIIFRYYIIFRHLMLNTGRTTLKVNSTCEKGFFIQFHV